MPVKAHYPLFPVFAPPYRMADIRNMTRREARAAYNWFIAESPKRIALLRDAMERDTGVKLDFSGESLIPLWEWAIPYMTPRNTPPCGIPLDETGIAPDPSNEGLHIVGLCLTFDIGYYLAEAIMWRCPTVKWTLCLRKLYPGNEAILTGIINPLPPHIYIAQAAYSVLQGKPDRLDLFETYKYLVAAAEAGQSKGQ